MEKFKLLVSEWDTGGPGPARRVYRLTELGDRCLSQWVETLKGHRDAVERFLGDFEHWQSADPSTKEADPSLPSGVAPRTRKS
jgi:DNA-binding PadR family transcriptional regulator